MSERQSKEIYNIGIFEKRFFSGYLNLACKNCKIENETQLFISCKTLVFGPIIFGINWWAWGKKASTYCRKCHHREDVIINNQTENEILNDFNEAKIPIKYRAGGGVLIVFASFLLLSFIIHYGDIASKKIVSFLESPQEKVTGKWINNNDEVVYFFKDMTYTAIIDDSLFTGNYKFNSQETKIIISNINNQEEISLENEGKINLKYDNHVSKYLKDKSIEISNDNPYHLSNQKWRVKSHLSESKQQVKNRVLQYLNFCKSKFEWGLENDIYYLDGDSVSPIEFSSGGILFSDESLKEWKPIFNSEENWSLANQILIKNLPRDYKFKEVNNNFENYRDIIQLYISNVEKNIL